MQSLYMVNLYLSQGIRFCGQKPSLNANVIIIQWGSFSGAFVKFFIYTEISLRPDSGPNIDYKTQISAYVIRLLKGISSLATSEIFFG